MTIGFIMSVHPSICPCGTTRLLLDGFSFSKNQSTKFKFHYNRARITGTLH